MSVADPSDRIARMRKFLAVLVVLALVAAGVWFWAGRSDGPALAFNKPGPLIGQTGELEVVVDPHGSELESMEIVLEQDGARTPLFTLPGDATTQLKQPDGKMAVTRPVGKRAVPALKAGKARFVATASRKVLFGLRSVRSEASRDVSGAVLPVYGRA